MKFTVDSHTHTISSGHAYCTVQEMARGARENGIEMIAITDHGSSMKGAPFLYHFANLKVLPREIFGVRVVKGVEANIISYEGEVDIPQDYLKRLEFSIASFHEICITPSTVEDHTRAAVRVLENPFIDAIAHPGNPQFQVDIERVVRAARDNGKLIEINNHSFVIRTGSADNCRQFAKLCKEYGVRVVCGSDAHYSADVGRFHHVYEVFEEVEMPEELVLNTSTEKFENYLKSRER